MSLPVLLSSLLIISIGALNFDFRNVSASVRTVYATTDYIWTLRINDTTIDFSNVELTFHDTLVIPANPLVYLSPTNEEMTNVQKLNGVNTISFDFPDNAENLTEVIFVVK